MPCCLCDLGSSCLHQKYPRDSKVPSKRNPRNKFHKWYRIIIFLLGTASPLLTSSLGTLRKEVSVRKLFHKAWSQYSNCVPSSLLLILKVLSWVCLCGLREELEGGKGNKNPGVDRRAKKRNSWGWRHILSQHSRGWGGKRAGAQMLRSAWVKPRVHLKSRKYKLSLKKKDCLPQN